MRWPHSPTLKCRAPLVRGFDELDQRMRALVFASEQSAKNGVSAMRPTFKVPRPVIVLVEEEVSERGAISCLLRQEGFRVRTAETTDAALKLVEANPTPCGLVTDAHEPGEIDGWELARRVRLSRPDVAVVLMSGHSDDTSWALPEGVEFLLKPNVVTNLVTTLRRMTGERQAHA